MESKNKPETKELTLFVNGMHCPSCELLIEKELLQDKNIKSVEASTSQGRVLIAYQGQGPLVEELNQKFKKGGYTFSEKPFLEKKKSPLFSFENGQLMVEKSRLVQFLSILGIAALFIGIFFLLNRLPLVSQMVVGYSSPLPAFFLFGLIAGISSCAALVGGLVLSMAKQWSEVYGEKGSSWQRFQPHFLFNAGRLSSFAFFGVLLGTVGGAFQISLTTGAFLAIAVSALMVFLGLQMLEVGFFRRFQVATPKLMSRFITNEANFKGRFMPLVLGGLTFFLPCGFTLTAQALALASGSAGRGALIMLFFALGTLPTLLAIGLSSFKLMAKPHLSARFLKIAGVLVLFFGLYNLNSQLNLLGLPSLSDVRLVKSQAFQEGLAPVVGGKQVLKMDALSYGYEPNNFKVMAGVPVRWEITNRGVSGCTNAIVSKGLFAGEIDLNQELVVKEFLPKELGRYKFSCWMGMISGVIEVVAQDGSVGSFVEAGEAEVPSGVSGCGGGCSGGCGGGCGNPNCPYAK